MKDDATRVREALERIEAAHHASALRSGDFYDALARIAQNDAVLRAALLRSSYRSGQDDVTALVSQKPIPI